MGGFTSNALGSVHTYPSSPTDQLNLSGSIIQSLLPTTPSTWRAPFSGADTQGTWDFRLHTPAQIQQVGIDISNHVITCRIKYGTLRKTVLQATTIEAVATVTW